MRAGSLLEVMHSHDVGLHDARKMLEIEKAGSPGVRVYRRGSWAVPSERKGHHESPNYFSTSRKLWDESSQLVHHGSLGKMQT